MPGYDIARLLGLSTSKARQALLALFFTNPGQEYFPRQLERITGIFVGNLQRELLRLERAGLLRSRRLGKLKLYQVQNRHPLYPELTAVVNKTIGIEEVLRGGLASVAGLRAACIYGSFASGQARHSSDLDVLVIGEPDEKALIRAVKGVEEKLRRELNYALYSEAMWKKMRRARDSFVMEVLRRPRIHIVGAPDAIR